MGFWPVVKHVVQNCDIIVLVVDARMPALSRNEELESMIIRYGKKLLVCFNKIDLISQKELQELRKMYQHAVFVSGNKNMGLRTFKERLFIEAKKFTQSEPKIGVVGYPNVGKSSVINALAKRSRAKVSNVAGTTRGVQWIRAGGLLISDTPGVIPMRDNSLILGAMGAKNPEKLEFPERAAYELIRHLVKKGAKNALEEFYKTELKKNPEEALIDIGKKRGLLKKGGVVDERRTAIQVLRDWQNGKIKVY